MKIIEKIEIKHFRSFKENVKVIDLKDLNVFSGSNDVGKSNVLKILNLFFNDEVSFNEKFSLENDLSFLWKEESEKKIKDRKETRKKQGSYASQRNLFVSVKIFFTRPVSPGSSTPESFWAEKRWDKKGIIGDLNTNVITEYKKKNKGKEITASQENAQKGLVSRFINSISFEYIPAVKDRKFFKYLFGKLQDSLFEREKKFEKTSKELNENIKNITTDLFDEFKIKTGVSAEFSIPKTLIDFFATINVSTENGISLYSRGDGIQARFIPAILNEISKGSKYVLWGFEEPENSYEYRAAEKLANDFLKEYSKDKQIFITSHTKEFLSLVKGNEETVSLYRVYETLKEGSLIDIYRKGEGFDKEKIKKDIVGSKKVLLEKEKNILNKIFEDIGFLETDQYLVENLQNQLKEQRRILKNYGFTIHEQEKIINNLNKKFEKNLLSKKDLEREIEEYKKPILYVEDEYIQLYKIAYLKSKGISCDENNLMEIFEKESPFIIYSKSSATELKKFLDFQNISDLEEKRIIGLFDFDSAFNQFKGLNKSRWKGIEGIEEKGLYRQRKDHKYFYALILPVPENRKLYASKSKAGSSALAVELFFTDEILKELGCLGEEEVTGVSEKRKKFLGRKSLFWKKTFDLKQSDFKNFKLIFDKMDELFKK